MLQIPKKQINKKCLLILFIVLIFCTIFFIMYKYHVEGEKNLPFNITKMVIISSANTQNFNKEENCYKADVIQKNDIYIAIDKNENYKKEETIKKIEFNNFQVIDPAKQGKIKIYRPSQKKEQFEYIDKYEIKEKIKYIGAEKTDVKKDEMTISNQGGIISISAILMDLGKITYLENENIESNGKLINRLNLTKEDIKTKVSFDMYIQLQGGNTFKTTLILDLPIGDIVNDGISTKEITDLSKLVFKRI